MHSVNVISRVIISVCHFVVIHENESAHEFKTSKLFSVNTIMSKMSHNLQGNETKGIKAFILYGRIHFLFLVPSDIHDVCFL